MSGLLALLDDVAGIAKVAAASLDDVASQAAKAGAKAAGAVIDDAAVTPKYVQGFAASRELPIIWKIAKGSFRNKLLYLLPVALVLSAFAPWLISPLLMIGGAYLCFEGAEKIWHALFPDPDHPILPEDAPGDPAHLEERKAAGAIKTDFILSAEIMTIALAALPESGFWTEAASLALVAIGITVVVYGSVAIIVKADDVGLYLARNARLGVVRALGRGVVRVMPGFLKALTVIGTAAMLWVGGAIILHGLEEMGVGAPAHLVEGWSQAVAQLLPEGLRAAAGWATGAALGGLFGLALGLMLVPAVQKLVLPLLRNQGEEGGS